jgi:Putative transmembrane protein (PGPGW)
MNAMQLDVARRPFLIRIVLTVIGGTLLLLGLVGLVIPVFPGWLLILPGLAILAGEFVWARRILDGAHAKVAKVRGRTSAQRKAA